VNSEAVEKYKSARHLNNRMVEFSTINVVVLVAIIFFLSPPLADMIISLAVVSSWVVFLFRFTPKLSPLRNAIAEAKFGKKEDELSEEEKEEFTDLLLRELNKPSSGR